MSDPNDAVRAAKAQNQKFAASCALRKEALAAEVVVLERQRASALELARTADPGLSVEAAEILRTIDERLAGKRTEMQAADADLKQALAEVRELDRLAGTAAVASARAIAASIVPSDPILRSPDQLALDAARSSIDQLDAQARLNAELAPQPTAVSAPGTAVSAPGTATSAPGVMDEAEARAKLAEMRAKLDPSAKLKKTL